MEILRKCEIYALEFLNYTDQEIVDTFNYYVYHDDQKLSTIERQIAIKKQFEKRNIDFSSVTAYYGISYKSCVILRQGKIIRAGDLEFKEVESLLIKFMTTNCPEYETSEYQLLKYDKSEISISLFDDFRVIDMSINFLIQMETFIPKFRIEKEEEDESAIIRLTKEIDTMICYQS